MFKGENIRNFLIYIACILIAIVFIFVGHKMNAMVIAEEETMEFYKATVVSIDKVETEEYSLDGENSIESKTIYLNAEVTNGPHKKEMIEVVQIIDLSYGVMSKEIEPGNRIIVSPTAMEASEVGEWLFIEYDRTATLIGLTLIFLLLVLLVGRGKGITTITALVFTVLAIFYVFVPSILTGRNIYLSTIVVASFIIVISLTIINGANKKTLCAIVGNIGGVAIAGIIAIMASKALNLTGFVDEDYIFLTYLHMDITLDLAAVVWSGIVIGSLGAVMDVAMSIASAMNELSENMESLNVSACKW